MHAVGLEDERAPLARGDDDGAVEPLLELLGGGERIVGDARELAASPSLGTSTSIRPSNALRSRDGRRRVQHDGDAGGLGAAGGGDRGLDGQLELEQQHLRCGDRGRRRARRRPARRWRWPGMITMEFSPESSTSGLPMPVPSAGRHHAGGVDAVASEGGEEPAAVLVVADPADHGGGGPGPGRGERLVAALAAEELVEPVAHQGLAGLRAAGGPDDQVHHEAPQDHDATDGAVDAAAAPRLARGRRALETGAEAPGVVLVEVGRAEAARHHEGDGERVAHHHGDGGGRGRHEVERVGLGRDADVDRGGGDLAQRGGPPQPVIATTSTPRAPTTSANRTTSAVLPDFEIASRRSSAPTMPLSPCRASAAWTNSAGVPVLARVAASFAPTRPDLPSPVTTTRPRTASRRSSAGRAPSKRAAADLDLAHDLVERDLPCREGLGADRSPGLRGRRPRRSPGSR